MKIVRFAGAGLAMGLALSLWGCDRGDSSAPAREHPSAASSSTDAPRSSDSGASRYSDRQSAPRTPPPMLDGKPMWADNREHTAQENVDYQFDHWGAGVGAKDAKDYARKARAFIENPPSDVEKITRRNGDVMMYDKSANIFAIVRKDGAPRLYRKPVDGAADWEKAKTEASTGGSYRSKRRYHAPDGGDTARGQDN